MKRNAVQLLDDLADDLDAVISDIALSKAERIIFQSAMDCLQNVGLDIGFMEKEDDDS